MTDETLTALWSCCVFFGALLTLGAVVVAFWSLEVAAVWVFVGCVYIIIAVKLKGRMDG